MFQTQVAGSKRRAVALLTSFVLHCVVVYMWLHRPPMFVRPSSVAWGRGGQSDTLVYLTKPAEGVASKRSPLQVKARKKARPDLPEKAEARAGSNSGSLSQGPALGREAAPALPIVFPDPAIYPWQLARGLQGDVIVEVTIDEQGNVTETRVLQSLQQDIDEKVIATLRNWRFKPATVDGVAISSRQDVHFHFPS
jgi:TonB family protein